jgi:ABC-type branched-subunit amino acid transport system permease subunit
MAGGLQFVLYGLIAILVVIFMPKGIVGIFRVRRSRMPKPEDTVSLKSEE